MFGFGVYFASDSSKSAQELYTKGSNKLLLCEVLLGKSYTSKEARNDMNMVKLKAVRCDSLFAIRDTRQTGGVLFDEFVIYNPDQAYPKYIIHYQKCNSQVDTPNTRLMFINNSFNTGRQTVIPSRTLKPDDPLDIHLRIAESQFLRLLKKMPTAKNDIEVKKVDIFMNSVLRQRFDAKLAEFSRKYGNKNESQFLYLFHGTKSPEIVEKIMNNNFIKSSVGKFGPGVYFSEFPAYTFGYGGENHLILSKVLPGKIYPCTKNQNLQQGYDSHGGIPAGDMFKEIVIFNTDQILPCYVIRI